MDFNRKGRKDLRKGRKRFSLRHFSPFLSVAIINSLSVT